jgi:hypothetical protein
VRAIIAEGPPSVEAATTFPRGAQWQVGRRRRRAGVGRGLLLLLLLSADGAGFSVKLCRAGAASSQHSWARPAQPCSTLRRTHRRARRHAAAARLCLLYRHCYAADATTCRQAAAQHRHAPPPHRPLCCPPCSWGEQRPPGSRRHTLLPSSLCSSPAGAHVWRDVRGGGGAH